MSACISKADFAAGGLRTDSWHGGGHLRCIRVAKELSTLRRPAAGVSRALKEVRSHESGAIPSDEQLWTRLLSCTRKKCHLLTIADLSTRAAGFSHAPHGGGAACIHAGTTSTLTAAPVAAVRCTRRDHAARALPPLPQAVVQRPAAGASATVVPVVTTDQRRIRQATPVLAAILSGVLVCSTQRRLHLLYVACGSLWDAASKCPRPS